MSLSQGKYPCHIIPIKQGVLVSFEIDLDRVKPIKIIILNHLTPIMKVDIEQLGGNTI